MQNRKKLTPARAYKLDLASTVKPVRSRYRRPCGVEFFNASHVLVRCGRRPHGPRGGWHREIEERLSYYESARERKKYWREYRLFRIKK